MRKAIPSPIPPFPQEITVEVRFISFDVKMSYFVEISHEIREN